MEKLKPCLCKGTKLDSHQLGPYTMPRWAVHCETCGRWGPTKAHWELAEKAWNQQATHSDNT